MKKPIIIGSIVIIGCITIAGAFIFRTKMLPQTNEQDVASTVTVSPKEELLWEDPAGFSFKYPSELTIDKHDEDTKNYAHIELTSKNHTGNIIIWAKDTTYQTIAAWKKGDAIVSTATSVDTTLGGKEAKKIMVSGTTKKIITGVIDEDVLITIEGDFQNDESYWTEVYGGITQTFVFSSFEATSDTEIQSAADDSGTIDEEEVLE